jgi:transcriptional regulator with XRE-family HTH domain
VKDAVTLVALTIELPTMTISDDESTFFTGFGGRVAQLRKACNITQVQLAEALGVSQQTVQSYEVGRRRIPVSTLRLLAETLAVSLDELMAEGEHAPRKRGPVPQVQVQRQLERFSALPKPKQRAVMDVIEALLAQQGR